MKIWLNKHPGKQSRPYLFTLREMVKLNPVQDEGFWLDWYGVHAFPEGIRQDHGAPIETAITLYHAPFTHSLYTIENDAPPYHKEEGHLFKGIRNGMNFELKFDGKVPNPKIMCMRLALDEIVYQCVEGTSLQVKKKDIVKGLKVEFDAWSNERLHDYNQYMMPLWKYRMGAI